MRATLLCSVLLFCLHSFAQLDENCVCQNPKDCEVGTVVCDYNLDHEGHKYSGRLIGKFVLGEDTSPEIGKSVIVAEGLKRTDVGFFASSCSTKSFSVRFTNTIYTFLKEGDFENWKYIVDPQVAVFADLDFNKNSQTKFIKISEKNYSLAVSCYGQANE